jgi:predicted acyltransferase
MATATGKQGRLHSLDVLRGITIAGMILVNNPGNWGNVYAPLRHAEWNGLTPTDLVFPFFMFIMGVSMYLSYNKFDFKFSNRTFLKLFRRSLLLFLIGVAIGWLGLFCGGLREFQGTDVSLGERIWQAATNFENVRILGVLQRLALVSFFGTLIILLVPHKHIPWLTGAILLIYWILIGTTGSYAASEDSIIASVDRAILGASHMYTQTLPDGRVIPFDPEGILSTLPCIAHVLLGFWAGKLISESKSKEEQIQKMAIFGTILFFAGFSNSSGMMTILDN